MISSEMFSIKQRETFGQDWDDRLPSGYGTAKRDFIFACQDGPDVFPNQVDALEKMEMSRMLNNVISKLPPDQEMAVRMRFLEEKSLKKIEKSLRIPRNSVRNLLNEALISLREFLHGQEGGLTC